MIIELVAWFLASGLLSTYANTTFLKQFQDPLFHTFIRFFGSGLLGTLTLISSGEVKISEIFVIMKGVFIPASLLLIANLSNSISLETAGITLTYVVKATIPVVTVLICSLSGQKIAPMIYLSLIPICIGVAVASGTDMDFNITGLTAALISTLAQTFMNISIKKVRESTGWSGSKAFLGMALVNSILVIPFMYIASYQQELLQGITAVSMKSPLATIETIYSDYNRGNNISAMIVSMTALGFHVEYAMTFILVGKMTSVAFSIADIARRIAIIVIGSAVFNKPLSAFNWIGIVVALAGVMWYSYLVNEENEKKKIANGVKKNS